MIHLDELLSEPISARGRFRLIDVILLIMVTFFALVIRFAFFPMESGDYAYFLKDWYESLQSAGGIAGIGLEIGNYTPQYLYILALLTYLPVNSLFAIKIVSCLFDFLAAILAAKLFLSVYQNRTGAMLAYTAVLLCPTVWLNSAAWAQCDSIFTFFLLASFFAAVKNRPIVSSIFFGLSFSFKLQAVFFAPLLLVLLLRGKMKFRYLFFIPGIYMVGLLPAAIAGRNFFEMLLVYLKQAGTYRNLSKNAASFCAVLADSQSSGMSTAMILICGTAVLLVLWWIWEKKISITPDFLLDCSLLFLILVPFLLPHMHERYFFPADLFALFYAIRRPKRFYVPILVVGASFLTYLPFLFGEEPVPLVLCAAMMGTALILVARHLYLDIKAEESRRIVMGYGEH